MEHHLDRVSLSVGLGGEYFEFDYRYFLGIQPFSKPELRYFIHECIHMWQLLGSGYLVNLARNRWLALRHWEATGQLPEADQRFTALEPSAGFSAWQLSEALCRFWDVHISGPPDLLDKPYAGGPIHEAVDVPPDWLTEGLSPEVIDKVRKQQSYTSVQFDEWMLQEDNYAEPYRRLLKLGGSKWAASLFPIVGHFALQTRNPPRSFIRALNLLTKLPLPATDKYISDTWRSIFASVANTCAKAAFLDGFNSLTPGADVIKVMAKEGHPVYGHYLALLAMANDVDCPIDLVLALPGDPELRARLAAFFLPPVVTFDDGRWTPNAPAVKMAGLAETMGFSDAPPGLLEQPQLADTADDLYRRHMAMQKDGLLKKYPANL